MSRLTDERAGAKKERKKEGTRTTRKKRKTRKRCAREGTTSHTNKMLLAALRAAFNSMSVGAQTSRHTFGRFVRFVVQFFLSVFSSFSVWSVFPLPSFLPSFPSPCPPPYRPLAIAAGRS
jgi:hypothetical protein